MDLDVDALEELMKKEQESENSKKVEVNNK